MLINSNAEIRAILLNNWDPIGIADVQQAHDEYDRYVGSLSNLIRQKKSLDQMSATLTQIEIAMGLEPDAARAKRVAEMLLNVAVR